MKLFAGSFGVLWLLLLIIGAAAWIHGIILAFSASVVLGIICFFLEVPYPVFAVVYWVSGLNLAQMIVDFFSK